MAIHLNVVLSGRPRSGIVLGVRQPSSSIECEANGQVGHLPQCILRQVVMGARRPPSIGSSWLRGGRVHDLRPRFIVKWAAAGWQRPRFIISRQPAFLLYYAADGPAWPSVSVYCSM